MSSSGGGHAADQPARANPTAYVSDGSNLPHVVDTVMRTASDRYADWMMHVREALPDIKGITTRMATVGWASLPDGSLPKRIGSTFLARLRRHTSVPGVDAARISPRTHRPYLIEEPENGIHPRAVETVFQSLSSVYDAQILLATHSPDIARLASVDQILCFARNDRAGTDVVAGSAHPRLRNLEGVVDLGTLLAERSPGMMDLVCLVADKNMEATVSALLDRPSRWASGRLRRKCSYIRRERSGLLLLPYEGIECLSL